MSGLAGQRSWMGDAAATPSGDARDDGAAAASSTNASAISFGFAATAILIAMFLLMAIFEHLIKPGWAASRGSHADSDADGDAHAQPSHPGRHQRDHGSPEKLAPPPKMEVVAAAADLTVVMPGQRYPTFLAQPAPLLLLPCPREGVRWPTPHHGSRRSFLPP